MTIATLKWPLARAVQSKAAVQYLTIVCWCAIFMGVAFRIIGLPDRTLFLDEAITLVRVAGQTDAGMMSAFYDGRQNTADTLRRATAVSPASTPKTVVSSLAKEDAQHPPLFYLAELLVVRTFGSALAVWRWLPAFFGILAIPAAYLLAREVFADGLAGLAAAALFAVSPIERIYSEQAREYSLLTLVVLLATFALARAVRLNSWRDWAMYGIIAGIGLYASPFVAYAMVGHAVFAMAAALNGNLRIAAWFFSTVCAAIMAFSPWLYEMIVHRNDIASTNVWSATTWPVTRLAAKWIFNVGAVFFDLEYMNLRWAIVLLVVVIGAAIALFHGFRTADRRARWCLGAATIVPLALLILPDILLREHRSSVARYALPAFAILPIVAARGMIGRPLVATLLLCAGLLSCAIGSTHASWWDNDPNADDAQIASLVNRVPNAQLLSTVPPASFSVYARLLDPRVTVSLAPRVSQAVFHSSAPLFVLDPAPGDLQRLAERTGLSFERVAFARTRTARELGAGIGAKAQSGQSEPTGGSLYRAVKR